MSRLAIFSALAAIASPVVIARVYRNRQRREVEEELQEALRSGDSARLSLACSRAEDAGLDASVFEKAKEEVRKLRAAAELHEAVRSGDVRNILRMCRGAEQLCVEEAALSEARAEVQRLLRAELESGDVTRILTACAYAPEAKLEDAEVAEGRTRARELARAELQEALDAAGAAVATAARVAAATRIALACQKAEAAGVKSSLLAQGRKVALRVRAEAELQEAVGSGDAERIEEACGRAEEAGAAAEAVDDARVASQRLRAEAELLEALQSGNARRIEVACFRAEKAGVDGAVCARGRAELARAHTRDRERREQAEAELLAAVKAQEEGPERLYRACRLAEEAGVDSDRVAEGRGEARRRFDLQELRVALEEGDAKRAFVASGGSLGNLPMER